MENKTEYALINLMNAGIQTYGTKESAIKDFNETNYLKENYKLYDSAKGYDYYANNDLLEETCVIVPIRYAPNENDVDFVIYDNAGGTLLDNVAEYAEDLLNSELCEVADGNNDYVFTYKSYND